MIHVMYNTAFTATDVASKILIFLKANYFKYQVITYLNPARGATRGAFGPPENSKHCIAILTYAETSNE